MTPVRLTPRMKRARKGAMKIACLIAFTASLTTTSLGEHFSSKCRVMPRLVPALPKSTVARFALHVSLRSFTSATSAARTAPAGDPEMYPFSISGSHSGEGASGTALASFEQMGSFKLRPTPDSSTLPHLLAWLDGWRMDMERGLFRPLRNQASRLAIAYTDIFDTRGNPDKGGHGLGILLRYDFRKAPDRR